MTDYRATPEQWHELERCSHGSQLWAPCILELRARVEALEANAKSTPNPSQIRSSARAAMRCIAGELRAQGFVHSADWFEREAER